MQTMLKEEPDSNKTGSLHKHTKELKKMVVSAVEDLVTVTEKERRVAMFQERVQKGIDHLNGVLQGPVQHERERDGLDAALMQKLPAYQELFSVLQLQVSYLATLSMTIKDEEASEVFVKVVCAIFADLHDARIRNLFGWFSRSLNSRSTSTTSSCLQAGPSSSSPSSLCMRCTSIRSSSR